MTLKLGFIRDKNNKCKSELCDGLQTTYRGNNLPNNSLNPLLRPQLSDEILKRETEFRQVYSSNY